MTTETEDFQIISDTPYTTKISGILRLPSPLAYEKPFITISEGIKNCNNQTYTIDLINLTFLNSSGITALARLIINARQCEQKLCFIGNENIPWQQKSLNNLKKLWSGISIILK